jgi:hypothetical protein
MAGHNGIGRRFVEGKLCTDNRMQRFRVDKKLKRIFDAVAWVNVISPFSGVSRVKVANTEGACTWLKFTTSLSALVKPSRG